MVNHKDSDAISASQTKDAHNLRVETIMFYCSSVAPITAQAQVSCTSGRLKERCIAQCKGERCRA